MRYGLIDKVLVPESDKGSKLDQECLKEKEIHSKAQGTRDPWSGQARPKGQSYLSSLRS